MATGVLEDYIRAVHNKYPSRKIFDHGTGQPLPTLKRNCVNRILLYGGSFNPPHRGHFEVLRHGFAHSGRDLNIIATIVLPLPDYCIKEKVVSLKEKDPLVFTKAKRIELWGPSNWYWAYDGNADIEFELFQESLAEEAAKDGFDVKWITVCGPDMEMFDSDEVLVTNVARPVNFMSKSSWFSAKKWKRLVGCGRWETVKVDHETLKKYAEEDARSLSPGMGQDIGFIPATARKLYEAAVNDIKDLAICHRTEGPARTIRFIPGKSILTDMSSTRVRAALQSGRPEEEVWMELENLVMHPEELLAMVTRKKGAQIRRDCQIKMKGQAAVRALFSMIRGGPPATR